MGNQEKAERLNYLLKGYRTNTCTQAELEELFGLMQQEDGSGLLQGLQEHWEESREMPPTADPHWDILFRAMLKESADLDMAPGAAMARESDQPVSAVSPRARRRLRRRRRLLAFSFCFLLLLAGT